MKLYFNGDFVPMTTQDASFEAMLVDDNGVISFTGSLDEAREKACCCCEEIDLEGKTVMPGFIDPHSHFGMGNNLLTTADLSGATCMDDIIETLRAWLAEHPTDENGVIVGMNYDHNNLAEYRHPTKFDLDKVSTEVPICILHVSCHQLAANTPMLAISGVNEDSIDPEGARYARVEGTREPNGYVEETAAMMPVYGAALARLDNSYDSLIEGMQEIYTQWGVTTAQEGATDAHMVDEFARLGKEGRINIDVVMYPFAAYDYKAMLEKHADIDSDEYTGHVRIGGLKDVLDGSPQGRTAWMTEPYTLGEEGEGYCFHGFKDDETVYNFAKYAVDTNHDYLAHANGDATADQILRCYAKAYADSENPEKDKLRPVMIHCQTARKDQYEQMPALNMIPSNFPSHIWYWGDAHLKNFGPERGSRVSAVGYAQELGLPYTFHTDCPVLVPNMLMSVWCAVNRITKSGVQLDESLKVPVFDALKAITINGAYQYHEEDRKGTLEAGKLADLAILDRNPLKVDPMEIRDINVMETVKEGKTLWTR